MTQQKTDSLELIMAMANVLPNHEITEILDNLQNKQPSIYRFIYGEPSDAISKLNRDMANLYLDLSFDIVLFFHMKFRKLPETVDEEWVINKISLLDAELKSLTNEIPMNDKFRKNLQNRFIKRSLEASIQMELLEYTEKQIDHYVSFNQSRNIASHMTKNMLFILIRLFGDLYSLEQ